MKMTAIVTLMKNNSYNLLKYTVTTTEVCGVKRAAVRWSRVANTATGANYHKWFPSG